MVWGVTGLLIGYAFVLFLLLCVLIYCRLHWCIKAICIVAGLGFFIITYYSFTPLLGWPTRAELPDQARFLGAYVRQPNKVTGDDGGIYLWAVNLQDRIHEQLPRAYQLPYSEPLHEKVNQAKRKTKNGVPQMVEVAGEAKSKQQVESQASNEGGGGAIAPVDFYDMPTTEPPAK